MKHRFNTDYTYGTTEHGTAYKCSVTWGKI
jgi:hypothetical protein